jgi:hypothetical protein
LTDHQDFSFGRQSDDRAGFRVVNPDSLAHLVVLQQNLVEIS